MGLLQHQLLHYLYGLSPAATGNRKESMPILAVGIPRSGTKFLRQALHTLGFDHTHLTSIRSYHHPTYRLLQKKHKTKPGEGNLKLIAKDFHIVLSDCMGVSDLIAAEFAAQLIAAYPTAKVILNVCRDRVPCYQSM
ncbi:hypothetical protein N7462_003588 [Penicillium macrosclerotiorum]|uniref:uncharacterized protein n=1 Tax=Penicillium macrosclerotiorum TaxID=303699 RepID=UPI002547B401|nr:uncharacterized protein N7462_003588 [Penicillium macrosclerotiorum]KAJ5689196.1 hypothetical protein N7462_003588 [Penicillium macrosclerotiorum]